jgi:hypothetical protein
MSSFVVNFLLEKMFKEIPIIYIRSLKNPKYSFLSMLPMTKLKK